MRNSGNGLRNAGLLLVLGGAVAFGVGGYNVLNRADVLSERLAKTRESRVYGTTLSEPDVRYYEKRAREAEIYFGVAVAGAAALGLGALALYAGTKVSKSFGQRRYSLSVEEMREKAIEYRQSHSQRW